MKLLGKLSLIILSMALVVLVCLGAQRGDNASARDSTILPSIESDLTALSLSDDNDHTVDLATPFAGAGAMPTVLLVRGDGVFLEGSDAPDAANDLTRDANVIYTVPVSGRSTWHFKRGSGAGTVSIRIKLYGAY